MKKIILFFTFLCFIGANAQNIAHLDHINSKKTQTVRELAYKKSPEFKRLQERVKALRKTNSNGILKSEQERSICLGYTSSSYYASFWSANPDSSIVAWVWDYGDNNTDTTYSDASDHSYYLPNGSSYFNVCLTTIDINGATQMCCDSIYIYDSTYVGTYCYSNFAFSVDSVNMVSFAGYIYSSDSVSSWLWDFGDSTFSSLQNPTHAYSTNGTYTVCLTVTSGNSCTNTFCYNVNVNDYVNSCNANFLFYHNTQGILFSDLSSTDYGNITSWSWDFGDSTVSNNQNPIHLYSSPGTYHVCLTISTDLGCTTTFCQSVYNGVNSTLIVDTIADLTLTISTMMFGSCVNVSNLTYTGAPHALGYFIDNTAEIDSAFNYGLILTTGSIYNAIGPNNSTSTGTNNSTAGDSNLTSIAGVATYDAAIVEFDFSSVTDTVIASQIVFASEEYPEFVSSNYNDVFAFYISGPGITGVKNLALVPGTTAPITINSVNQNINAPYYVDNLNGVLYEYDGRTTIIQMQQAVIPGQMYHFKIAIADAGDGSYDSGVLIKAGSFNGNLQVPVANYSQTVNNLTVNFNNTSTDASTYSWDFGDGNTSLLSNPTHTYAVPGTYSVVLVASNLCNTDIITMMVTVGSTSITSLASVNVLKVIPTANEGVFNASLNSSINEKMELKVFNVRGQLVLYSIYSSIIGPNNFIFDLSAFSQGIYTLQITGAKEVFTSRLVR